MSTNNCVQTRAFSEHQPLMCQYSVSTYGDEFRMPAAFHDTYIRITYNSL